MSNSTTNLTNRVQRVKLSATIKISDLAKQLKSQGQDIIGLSAGEPDFATPKNICEAAINAINKGDTHYTPVAGTKSLIDAVINKFKRENSLEYAANQISVGTGCKQTIFNLFLSLLQKGDEMLTPAPAWMSYMDIAEFCHAKPILIPTTIQSSFKISPEQLDAAITPQTKLFILNSPSNPSGQAYTKEELLQLAKVLLKYPHVYIATDDIYEHLLWGSEFYNIVNVCPELKDRTIVLNGVSKAYAMTGWRIGYAAGPKEIIAAMNKIQSQSTSGACSISQAAAVEALNGDQSCLKDMLAVYKKRHDFVYEALNNIPGIKSIPSVGTFYNFFNIQEILNNNSDYKTDLDFSGYLIKQGLALVPGSAFGLDGYLRMSFAASDENLQKGLNKLSDAIKKL